MKAIIKNRRTGKIDYISEEFEEKDIPAQNQKQREFIVSHYPKKMKIVVGTSESFGMKAGDVVIIVG